MKLKNISMAAFAAMLLMLFFPVFYHVIMYGNNMNYNPDHKIYALYGNRVMLALTLIGVLTFLIIIYFARKIPVNKYTVAGFVGIAFISVIWFYMANVQVSMCIPFYGGWDCGMVANSARWLYEGKDLGYDDYYYIFTNNVPITWLLHELYSFASEWKGYPYNPEFIWIQFQCAMHALTVFLTAMTVLLISKNVGLSGLVLIVNMILLGLSPWKVIPYTDAAPIAFPILTLFLYVVFLQMKSRWKYLLWFMVCLVGMLGGIMKATCYVTLIAIVIVDCIWVMLQGQNAVARMKELAVRMAVLACGIALAVCCRNGMYSAIDYEYDYDMDIGWTGFLYDGLNEESTGACSKDGYDIVQNFAGQPREQREEFVLEGIKDRIAEKGFMGLLDFWLRKQVMTYNDGTFSWYQEGFFNAKPYENLTDSSLKEPLRDFYWLEGDNYLQFVTISHGVWLFVLVGILVEAGMVLLRALQALRKRTDAERDGSCELQISTVLILTFIGVFLFVMLFEGRARYLYTSVPVFATMAVTGFYKLVNIKGH
ncbi:MAG: hypothetical protein E7292_12030 [Lachnospiraceae bacterium]|nr:hypothetical protein [Lachnospiraceae bacterium]